MKILVDIGNHRIQWSTDRQLRDSSRTKNQSININEHEMVAWLTKEFSTLPTPSAVWSVCVNSPRMEEHLKIVCKKLWGVSAKQIISRSSGGGVCNSYKCPSQLGADRWAASVAAYDVYGPGPLVVIDAGTAVTVDYIDNSNTFQGGVIIPGINAMIGAVNQSTDRIRLEFPFDHNKPAVVNNTTVDSVNNGAILAVVGGVDYIVGWHKRQHLQEISLVVTGGDGDLVKTNSCHNMIYDSDLVLRGVLILSEEING